MAYPCDLPANMGNTDILRAIYNKIGNIDPSTGKIEEQLDNIFDLLSYVNDLLEVVNNNIETNTQAIKDISINVDIHSKDIQGITEAIDKQTQAIKDIQIHIDTSELTDSVKMVAYKVEENGQLVASKMEDGFAKTAEAIKSIQPGPTPPVPPYPPHPPYPPFPPLEPDVIFYPVTIGLPEPMFCYKIKPRRKKCECKPKETKYDSKVFVKPEQRPNYGTLNPNLCNWKAELERTYHTPKIRYPR